MTDTVNLPSSLLKNLWTAKTMNIIKYNNAFNRINYTKSTHNRYFLTRILYLFTQNLADSQYVKIHMCLPDNKQQQDNHSHQLQPHHDHQDFPTMHWIRKLRCFRHPYNHCQLSSLLML